MTWNKFDKHDQRTWPPEGKRVLFYCAEYKSCYVGYGGNYNSSPYSDEFEDNVIMMDSVSFVERIAKYENKFSHWTEITEFPEE